MVCTQPMYDAFKKAAFSNDNESLADAFKNGIEAALQIALADKNAQLQTAVEIVDEILPQAGHVSMDWGRVNEFLCAARPKR